MHIETIQRPDFDATHTGALRMETFRWLLSDVLPQGETLLDLGAGPCIFAKEAAAAGYSVTAVDGRSERVPDDLPEQIKFVQADVRDFPAGGHDVVLILGLLYHLTLDDQIALMQSVHESTVVLETQVHVDEAVVDKSGAWATTVVPDPRGYEGVIFPEGNNPMASIGNTTSFWHTEPSLLRMVEAAGFVSCKVVEPYHTSKYGARKFYVLSGRSS